MTDQFVIFRILNKRDNFLVGLVYINQTCNFLNMLNELRESIEIFTKKFPDDLFIIGGDFNSRVAAENEIDEEILPLNSCLSAKKSSLNFNLDSGGRRLKIVFEELGFILINERTPSDFPANYTFVGKQWMSVNDLIWCNINKLEYVKDMEVMKVPTGSDNFPVAL